MRRCRHCNCSVADHFTQCPVCGNNTATETRADFNPYEILGVEPTAGLDEIKKAYRARVMKCHPDRGGTHEEMVAVAEAWEILSDENARARFDETRRQSQDQTTLARWESARESARKRAEAYTRTWESLRERMAQVAADMNAAEYQETYSPIGFSFPIAYGSFTGYFFSLGGLFLGFAAGVILVVNQEQTWKGREAILIMVLATTGGWLGTRTHRAIRDLIRRRSRRLLLDCGACGRKLRLQDTGMRVEVTCPSCSGKFLHEPNWESWNKELRETHDVLRKDRRALLTTLLAAAFAAFIYLRTFPKAHDQAMDTALKARDQAMETALKARDQAMYTSLKEASDVLIDVGYAGGFSDARNGAKYDPEGLRKRLREPTATRPASR